MERVGVVGRLGMRRSGCDLGAGVCVGSCLAGVGWVGLDGDELRWAGVGWGGVMNWGRAGVGDVGRIGIWQSPAEVKGYSEPTA